MNRPTDTRAAAEQKLEALIDRQLDFVWRLMRRFGLSAADADDATQTVFIVASDRLEQIGAHSERSFLYGTALRVCANARRIARRRREVATLEPDIESPSPLPDDRLEHARATAVLDGLLTRLAVPLRRAFILAELEQCSVSELAELEQIPVGTAASRLRRARSRFRELLDAESPPNPFREADS
ncbi:RNA polymerase sigma factor [Myxococcota bacterium]